MSFGNLKFLYAFSCFCFGLLLLSPTLAIIIKLPEPERFSQIWILDSDHTTENYSYNVRANEAYRVYVDVGNHMGGLEYYMVYVKFRNQTDPLPNETAGTASPLSPLYEYRFLLQHGQSFEAPLTFSFHGLSFFNGYCFVENVTVNELGLSIGKSVLWNVNSTSYECQFFFELWMFNAEFGAFEYQNMFVTMGLNMTG